MWLINVINVSVTGKGKGECSVKLLDDEDISLCLNKIVVDLSDGAEPVQVFKHLGTPVISGTFVDGLKEMILDAFQSDLKDRGVGLYQISENGIEKL